MRSWPAFILALVVAACSTSRKDSDETRKALYPPLELTTKSLILTERIAFPAPEGKERVVPTPGVYRVEAGDGTLALFLGDSKQPLAIRAKRTEYEGEKVEAPTVLLRTGEDPEQGLRAITLVLPDGTTHESLGTLEGTKPRGLLLQSYQGPTSFKSYVTSWNLRLSSPGYVTLHWNRRQPIRVLWELSGIPRVPPRSACR